MIPPADMSRLSTPVLHVLAVWVLSGAAMALSGLWEGWEPAPALSHLVGHVEVGIGLSIGISGILLMLSAVRWPMESTRWMLERIGLPFGVTGWGAYALAAFVLAPQFSVSWLVAAGFAVSCAVRWSQVVRHARVTRARVRFMESPPESNIDA